MQPPAEHHNPRSAPEHTHEPAHSPDQRAEPARPSPDRTADTPEPIYLNRDQSWLEFNRRVLALAKDPATPLLERARFLAIFSSNLDEFVMKRIGLLKRRLDSGRTAPDADGHSLPVLLASLRNTIHQLQQEQTRCYLDHVVPALQSQDIHLVGYSNISDTERRWLKAWHRKNVFPILTPLAVDPGHRFPFISNLSRNFGVLIRPQGSDREPSFARVKIPSSITQWARLPDELPDDFDENTLALSFPQDPSRGKFVSLRDIMHNNLQDLFPGMEITEILPFRVIRDSEGEPEDDEDDDNTLLEAVEAELKRRRFADPVRLETGPDPSPRMVGRLATELKLTPADVDQREGPLDFTTLFQIADLDRPDLRWPRWTPVVPAPLRDNDTDIFSLIRNADILVHHPYESFNASAERFIAEAAADPDVLAIKQTIYRTSPDSPFVSSLIRAAEAGKQVAVLVELRARFDEERNVRLARKLENAGAHVAYGVVGLKTHCKASLVVRREAGTLRSYAHLGTGNYHPKTAQLYTDLGLFTQDPDITHDAVELFNFLTGHSRQAEYKTLLVAPVNMKQRFLELIDDEARISREHAAGNAPVGGRIVAKMNAFADNEVAERLYKASNDGVKITLFIRGFSTLRPKVHNLSDNIRVVSVVGRFLEHSRIFHFGAGAQDPIEGHWYIASADWMYRNLNNRVESACPVRSPAARQRLFRIFQIMSQDRLNAWELEPDGSYTKRTPDHNNNNDTEQHTLGTFDSLMQDTLDSQT